MPNASFEVGSGRGGCSKFVFVVYVLPWSAFLRVWRLGKRFALKKQVLFRQCTSETVGCVFLTRIFISCDLIALFLRYFLTIIDIRCWKMVSESLPIVDSNQIVCLRVVPLDCKI
jgi:hypothetical protein